MWTDFEALMNASIMERSDKLAPKFRVALAGFLQNQSTFDHDFENLSKYIQRTPDPNNRFRIFGYDEFTGGKRHEMINIAQIELPDGRVITEFLNNANDLTLGNFNDVIIFDIEYWGKTEDEQDLYAFIGWGSNGPKHHFEAVRMYKFNGVHLEQINGIFTRMGEPVNEIAIEAPRSSDIDIQLNSRDKSMEFYGYVQLPSGGWGKSKNPVKLNWNGSSFTSK
jgi:hypothetical protein